MKRALITGLTGQDGSYLAKHLLGMGYEVYGTLRRSALADQHFKLWRLTELGLLENQRLHIVSADVTNPGDVYAAVREARPDEIYHLAAQSDVAESFRSPSSTLQGNIAMTQNVLEAARQEAKEARVYFAGSSEMFGKSPAPQNEDTPFYPLSPYAVSKVAGYQLCHIYREAYGMFVACGILFNHESPLRGAEFVTRKVCRAAARIKLRKQDKLLLGRLDTKRDWGYAPDYVVAMHLMLQIEEPDDFVIATGLSHDISYLCSVAFDHLDLDWQKSVRRDDGMNRPLDVPDLRGNASEAHAILNWKPTITFEDMIREMVDKEMERNK